MHVAAAMLFLVLPELQEPLLNEQSCFGATSATRCMCNMESSRNGLGMMQELERALREFVAMPTVSCDPAHRDDCWRGAKFLGTLLESLGELSCSRQPTTPMRALKNCQASTLFRATSASPARHTNA